MGPGRSVHFAHSVSVHPGIARYVYGVGWEVEGAGGGLCEPYLVATTAGCRGVVAG